MATTNGGENLGLKGQRMATGGTTEGKISAAVQTPRSIARLLVEMPATYHSRAFNPCCESGAVVVRDVKFVEVHKTGIGDGRRAKRDISVYGEESNHTTWRLAKMDLAIRGVDAKLGTEHADSFRRDLHPDPKADLL